MVYISVFLILFIAVLFEFIRGSKNPKVTNVIFIILAILLTLMSAIRYGSGSDYFGYMWHYNGTASNVMEALASKTHMNPGYKVIMSISKSMGLEFEGFIFMLSLVLMITMTYLIWKNSKFKTMSLIIFYSIYYHIYINSALRQGITLVIFLWAFYKYAKHNKMIPYCIAILVGGLFHYSILVMLIIPVIKFIYDKYAMNKLLNIGFICIAIISFVFKFDRLLPIIGGMVGINIAYSSSSPRIMAILLRIVLMTFIIVLYKFSDKEKVSDFDKFQIYSYYIGVLIFIAVSNTPNLSRLTEFFSILDVFIIPNLINAIKVSSIKLSKVRIKQFKLCSILFCTLVIGVIFIKDQASFIVQGEYECENVLEYPYITLFNKEEIFRQRYVSGGLTPSEYRHVVHRFSTPRYRVNLISIYLKEIQRIRMEEGMGDIQ